MNTIHYQNVKNERNENENENMTKFEILNF